MWLRPRTQAGSSSGEAPCSARLLGHTLSGTRCRRLVGPPGDRVRSTWTGARHAAHAAVARAPPRVSRIVHALREDPGARHRPPPPVPFAPLQPLGSGVTEQQRALWGQMAVTGLLGTWPSAGRRGREDWISGLPRGPRAFPRAGGWKRFAPIAQLSATWPRASPRRPYMNACSSLGQRRSPPLPEGPQ